MAKLHVIYDPHDKLSNDPEIDKRFDLKVAIMSISENLSQGELEEYAVEIGRLLLEQVRLDEPA